MPCPLSSKTQPDSVGQARPRGFLEWRFGSALDRASTTVRSVTAQSSSLIGCGRDLNRMSPAVVFYQDVKSRRLDLPSCWSRSKSAIRVIWVWAIRVRVCRGRIGGTGNGAADNGARRDAGGDATPTSAVITSSPVVAAASADIDVAVDVDVAAITLALLTLPRFTLALLKLPRFTLALLKLPGGG